MKEIISNGNKSIEITKFLLALNKEKRELYILHREFPACLIYVEQDKVPVNFVVFDLYESSNDHDKAIEILTSEKFKSQLRAFFISETFDKQDFN